MSVTPFSPSIGKQRLLTFLSNEEVDLLLFHDGNQSGHVSKPVESVDTSNDTVSFDGNIAASIGNYGFLQTGDTFSISGSTGNNGTYTVSSLTYDYEKEFTIVGVSENISNPTPDGSGDFGNTSRGDNLQKNDRLTDITTEPSDGGYTRITEPLELYDGTDGWRVQLKNDVFFDNLDNTTGIVDAIAVVNTWEAIGDSSPTDHILFTTLLEEGYNLDKIKTIAVPKETVSFRP